MVRRQVFQSRRDILPIGAAGLVGLAGAQVAEQNQAGGARFEVHVPGLAQAGSPGRPLFAKLQLPSLF